MHKRIAVAGILAIVLAVAATPAVGAPSLSDLRALVAKSLRLAKDNNAAVDRLDARMRQLASERTAGPRGSVGPAGAAGPRGADGARGPQGPAGKDGADGQPGAEGAQGSRGERGAEGSPGAAGAEGSRGSTGSTGPQGDRGPQGDQGLPGEAGSQGEQGSQGEPGSPGAGDPMWASIDAEGGLRSGHRVESVASPSTGIYEIVFERAIEGCALTATPHGSEPAMASIEVDRREERRATVYTFGMDAKDGAGPRSIALDISALCPEKLEK
jgi:hypothetical protein